MNLSIETQLEFDFMKPEQLTLDFDPNLYIASGDYHKLLTITPNPSIHFHNKEKTVGKLDWTNGTMKFEGDVEESAQLFFDHIIRKYSQMSLPFNGWKS